jgi:predicted amidohydrolase YtcJ
MPKIITFTLLWLLSSLVFGDTTLLSNINGYTLDANRNLVRFTALQFTDDRVDRVFQTGDTLPDSVDSTIDGDGKTLIPGLIDAHGHVLNYGLSLLRVDLVATTTELEAAERVARFDNANPELEWIQGRGWNQVLWDSNSFPNAASLDSLIPDKPVWLTRVDGHAGWANSAAMELAGITRQTEDPNGGQIIRDENGDATGVFIDNAMALIRRNIPVSTMPESAAAQLLPLNNWPMNKLCRFE